MATKDMSEALESVLEYADKLTDHTLDNIENLAESTNANFAASVFFAMALNVLIMNCKDEYERRGYKDLEIIVGAVSDAVREALKDCKPTAH